MGLSGCVAGKADAGALLVVGEKACVPAEDGPDATFPEGHVSVRVAAYATPDPSPASSPFTS